MMSGWLSNTAFDAKKWPSRPKAVTTSSAMYSISRGIVTLCAPRAMIPAFQGFLFGGGVNPYVSRVATYYMRDNLVPHVARLVDIYRLKRDAMLKK